MQNKKKKTFLILIVVLIAFIPFALLGLKAKWTFMVYISADNDLEPYGIIDLNMMEYIGSTSNVEIVVQMDRTSGYDTSNGNWTGTRRYHVIKDTSQSNIGEHISDIGEQNMGLESTL